MGNAPERFNRVLDGPIDIRKTRRRIEDALRKTATKEEILHIAELLSIRVEPLKTERCSRCGLTDYVASDDYPEGLSPVGGEMLCQTCSRGRFSKLGPRHRTSGWNAGGLPCGDS